MKCKVFGLGKFKEVEKLTGEKVIEWDSETDAVTLSDGTEWKVLTDAEADKVACEEIRSSLWAFNTDFILEHCKNITDYNGTKKAIEIMQSKSCESCNDIVFLLIGGKMGFEYFAIDAIDADGRGQFIAWYDGIEHEAGDFYAYRIN